MEIRFYNDNNGFITDRTPADSATLRVGDEIHAPEINEAAEERPFLVEEMHYELKQGHLLQVIKCRQLDISGHRRETLLEQHWI